MEQTIQNSFESKVSIKIETNSRGFNTIVHVYQGVDKKEIDDTVAKAIYAHKLVQTELVGEKLESRCEHKGN